MEISCLGWTASNGRVRLLAVPRVVVKGLMVDRVQSWDVVVVGAGPGGSAAAYFCARAGLRTLVLERAHFPRDKTCGDGIGAGGIAVLREMGIYDQLADLGAGRATGYGLSSPAGCSFRHRGIAFESAIRPESLLIAPRRILDQACATAAERAGASLRQGARVRELLFDGDRACGVRLADGAEVRAALVIGADGVHSCVARSAGLFQRDPHHTAFALRVYYRNLSRVGEDAFFIYDQRFLPAYFWIFPLPDGRANVGIGAYDRYQLTGAANLKELFWRFAQENRLVRHLLQDGEPEGRLLGWPLRLGTSSGPGVADGLLLVGDANAFIDPLTGEGIHFALRSGQLAAETAARAVGRGDLSSAGLGSYTELWRAEFADEFKQGNRALDLLMSRPGLTDAVVELGQRRRQFAVLLGEVFSGLRPKRELLAWPILGRIGAAYLRRMVRGPGPDAALD